MRDLETCEVLAIKERAEMAMDALEAIIHECDQMYQSRRYIIEKAINAKEFSAAIVNIATGDV